MSKKYGIVLAAWMTLIAAAPEPRPVPSAAALRTTIAALVGFGTRHTLSVTDSPTRGIGAARRWTAARFAELGAQCEGCLKVETIGDQFTGPRAPSGVRVEDVFAVQTGTSEPERVIIIQGHIDSRVSDGMNATSDAPGANDDASGVALVLESARLLSRQKFPATIVYAVLSGEEQGLWGGQLLAKTAKARGWKIAAVLNNDIVGNTHGIGGEHITDTVRVFSEGGKDNDDTPSRALAKAVKLIGGGHPDIGLNVIAIRRADRFQRGGDHLPFLEAGFPAVRFTEATENYDRQHQDVREDAGRHFGDTIDYIDFDYLAKVTALNMTVAGDLARAPGAPTTVTISGAVSDNTHIAWSASPGAAGYRIYWRRADGDAWTGHRDVPASAQMLDLKAINIDDNFFGVAALSSLSAESLVTRAEAAKR